MSRGLRRLLHIATVCGVSVEREDERNRLPAKLDDARATSRWVRWWFVPFAGLVTFGVALLAQANAVGYRERCLGNNLDAGDRAGYLFDLVVVGPVVGVLGALTALAVVVPASRRRWPPAQ